MKSDMDTPKIGEKRQQKMEVRIARQERSRFAAAVAVAFLVGVVLVNLAISKSEERKMARASAVTRAGEARAVVRSPLFAVIAAEGISLRLPASTSDIIGIGYHQAYNPRAAALESRLTVTENATRASISRMSRAGRPRVFQMASRGRGSAPTSSVDVAVKEGTPVKSPVSGKVAAVEPYLLYGRYDDVRIDLLPKGNSRIKISIVHLDRPAITVGQRVEAGVTVLAVPRRLPVNSQIDQYLGQITDHIHLQINPLEPGRVVAGAN